MLDLFLSEKYNKHWPHIAKLAMSDAPEDFDLLIHYAMEGLRLSECSGVIRSVTTDDTIIDDGDETLTLHKNETVFLNFVSILILLSSSFLFSLPMFLSLCSCPFHTSSFIFIYSSIHIHLFISFSVLLQEKEKEKKL